MKGIDSIPSVSGVYIIRNLANKKCYVGCSANMYRRLKRHMDQLIAENHPSMGMREDYRRSGKHFECSVLERAHHKNMKSKEREYRITLTPEYCGDLDIATLNISAKIRDKLKYLCARKRILMRPYEAVC